MYIHNFEEKKQDADREREKNRRIDSDGDGGGLEESSILKKTGTTLAHQLTIYMPRICIFVLKQITYIIILYVLYMLFEIMSSSSLHKFKTKWISLSFYFF